MAHRHKHVDYNLNISWTQPWNGAPPRSDEIRALADQLYREAVVAHELARLEEIDRAVTGETIPEAIEMIAQAWQGGRA
jgi:hypothetical protein